MNDAGGVCMSNGIQNWMHDGNRLDRRQTTVFLEIVAQILTRHQFKNQIKITLLFIGLKDGNDVGVTQLADHACFGKQLLVFLRIGTRKM